MAGDMWGASYLCIRDLFKGGDTQFEGVGVPDKLLEGVERVGGAYLVNAHPHPIAHSSPLLLSSHLHLTMPQVFWGTAMLAWVGLWSRDEEKSTRLSQIDHIWSYMKLNFPWFMNIACDRPIF